jgi:hypothetical protein
MMESRSIATYKSKSLLNDIKSKLTQDFDFKMKDLLSICDSEIEKLFLVHFYKYFVKQEYKGFKGWSLFEPPQFILYQDPSYSLEDFNNIQDFERFEKERKFKKFRWRHGLYEKYIGIKAKESILDPRPLNGLRFSSYQQFCIYPQYFETINNKTYRIDIAIILNRLNLENQVIESKKIAIECDGYDYHSSPEQKKNDDIRSRELKVNGWKEVFRYSGKEIVQMSDDDFDEIFSEIMTMLYL